MQSLGAVADAIGPGRPLYLVLYAVLIVLWVFVYAATVIDPDNVAATLSRYGGTLPAVAPGEDTAARIDFVVTRTIVIGAAYLVVVCLPPEVLAASGLPIYFTGPSLLLAVCVALDLAQQMRRHRGA